MSGPDKGEAVEICGYYVRTIVWSAGSQVIWQVCL
jgi:hypothetical protein